MPQSETTTYYLLDSHQGRNAVDGWRVQHLQGLQITPDGLRLAPSLSPPVPLKDAQGAFDGLENPTGVAINSDGVIYVSDSKRHFVYKVVRREGLESRAQFFRIGKGPFANDRFVYVPTANRLERWPGALGRDPQSFSEVEVIYERVWNETQARKCILSFIKTKELESIEKECCNAEKLKKDNTKEADIIGKEEDYPVYLPAGELCKTSIEYLPCLGGLSSTPRQFNEPRGLAISPSGDLYVADSKNHRIQVFALRGLVLKAIWGKRASTAYVPAPKPAPDCLPPEEQTIHSGQPLAGTAPGEFNEPWDVMADGEGNVYIADKGNHRVQKFDCRSSRFIVVDGTVLSAHFFQVLYGPAAKERFVFIPARRRLERWSHSLGRDPLNIGEVTMLSENVPSTSAARKLLLETIGAKGAKDILVEWDGVYPLESDAAFQSPTHLAIDAAGRFHVVDEKKDYVKFLDRDGRVLGQVTYVSEVSGQFKPTAVAIDADGKLLLADEKGIHRFYLEEECCYYDGCCTAWRGRCAGMAIDMEGNLFTVGSHVSGLAEVKAPSGFVKDGTLISGPFDSDIENCQWHKILIDFEKEIPTGTSVTVWTYTSETKQKLEEILALEDEDWQTDQTNAKDFLIQSTPGQFLWLKIRLKGNGVDTPVLQHLKVYFPRLTYMQYLPAVYQADPVSKGFLERFLSIFENVLSGIEDKVENIWRLFDPDGVPDAPKDFLSWLAGWIDMVFDPSWSTETRRRLLRNAPELYKKRGTPAGLKKLLHLALDVDVQILEHFQLRHWLFLAGQSSLGDRSQLWGNCIVSRLQLEENSRIGDFALVGTGDPLRDPFFVYAHKFSVFVQAGLIHSALIERMMRYLIEREKPAHTQFDLVKVEPRFRIGMQSTIGLDTQVGAYPNLVLNHCATLGYDTLLGCAPEEKGPATLKVGERSRVGVTAVVG